MLKNNINLKPFLGKAPVAFSLSKQKFINYLLIATIICFFIIPLLALCLYECKVFPYQKVVSFFLFFFR